MDAAGVPALEEIGIEGVGVGDALGAGVGEGRDGVWRGLATETGLTLRRSAQGVTHSHTLDADLLKSGDARRIHTLGEELATLFRDPLRLLAKGEELRTVNGPVALLDAVLARGREGLTIQRYKGLGEMNPEQLWETTLDPTKRSLLQVKIAHADQAEEVFSTLMGDVVEPRREFIQENALKVANLDV